MATALCGVSTVCSSNRRAGEVDSAANIRTCLEGKKQLLMDQRTNPRRCSRPGKATKRTAPLRVLSASYSSSTAQPRKCAVLGAGFAGLSVVWHLLKHSPKESNLCIDIYDEIGIGGGASGVAGGLLHPYSPKAKLLWKAAECWRECQNLLATAEAAANARALDSNTISARRLVWRRGIMKPATAAKNVDILKKNAQNGLGSCRLEFMNRDAAQNLLSNLCVPFDSAVYMPQAMNVHPQRYLQALFLACQNLVQDFTASGYKRKEIHVYKETINDLGQLAGDYDVVVLCLGAKANMLPELQGKLPLRLCRGVVAHLALPKDKSGEYPDGSPSILSDAWVAAQGTRNLVMGSTWDWSSKNSSPFVSPEEASTAMDELTTKMSVVYPSIRNWTLTDARAGLRAMPPLTPLGSLPVLGCLDEIVPGSTNCKYWIVGGLGSRGLLYHGWLGKLMANAVLLCTEDVLPLELISWKKKQ
ncbi:hypothetical protein H6P81_000755 [Aristolochia fimbriata]|uniref:FAD dependent oxidoreductase domain-containing protein n=1 Tax=Aristolochia fimbriata TaxID=158543 RepID=A0AAV7F554_ARIFI|nr:hypothetical protein H6P81_000755 [Aristolochia fimbriata]